LELSLAVQEVELEPANFLEGISSITAQVDKGGKKGPRGKKSGEATEERRPAWSAGGEAALFGIRRGGSQRARQLCFEGAGE